MHLRRRRRPKPKPDIVKSNRVNQTIRSHEVRVIDQDGKNLGTIPTSKALDLAKVAGLDLVEVNPKAEPPVCRIMNYGQFRYEQEKESRKAKARQKIVGIKGLRLSLRIKGADLDLRRNQAKEFLDKGDKVKIELVLRGRERAHTDHAQKIMDEFIESLENINVIQPVSRQGGRLSMIIAKK